MPESGKVIKGKEKTRKRANPPKSAPKKLRLKKIKVNKEKNVGKGKLSTSEDKKKTFEKPKEEKKMVTPKVPKVKKVTKPQKGKKSTKFSWKDTKLVKSGLEKSKEAEERKPLKSEKKAKDVTKVKPKVSLFKVSTEKQEKPIVKPKEQKAPLFKKSEKKSIKPKKVKPKPTSIETKEKEIIKPIKQKKEPISLKIPKKKKAVEKEKKPLFSTKGKISSDAKTLKTALVQKSESMSLSPDEITNIKEKAWDLEGIVSADEWNEIDFYWIIEPFAFVSIIQHKVTKEIRYFVLEVELDETESQHLSFIKDTYEILPADTAEMDNVGLDVLLNNQVLEIISDYSLDITPLTQEKILYYMRRDCLGLSLIDPLMKDVEIEDISCDGANASIFIYHRKHGSIQSNIIFPDEEDLAGFVVRIAQKCGKHISISHPMLDATMPDGSRIQMTLSTEVSTKGSTFTIRKFKEQPFSPSDLIKFNTMSNEMMAYLWLAVQHGSNALISGGTASGKTSALNAISLFIPRESKIVSIEETREINLPHPNWIPGVSRSGFGDVVNGKLVGEIDLFDLMKAALRQRPEYILVGEIRGREAYVLFQAMATGHTTYSTVHADSTKSLIHRLEGEPINIPRIMLQALDIVCIQTIARVKNKRVRRCKQIVEIIDIDPTTKEILTNEVFRWDPVKDTFQFTGKSYILDQIRVKLNIQREDITNELKKRSEVLDWMVDKEIHEFEEVASVCANYLDNPEDISMKVNEEKHE